MQLTSSRPSEPAASPGNVGGCAGRPVLRAELRPSGGPTHPLPPAGPTLTGARHAGPAPDARSGFASDAGGGERGGREARSGPTDPSRPNPRLVTVREGAAAAGPRPQTPEASARARAQKGPPPGSGTRTRSGTRRGARAVGPNQGRAAEAQARPRPLAPVAAGRGRGLGPPT